MKIADNKKQFDSLFEKVFGNVIQGELFPADELLEMFEPEKPAIEGKTENDKIINSIQRDFPLIQTENFEKKLEKISFKK